MKKRKSLANNTTKKRKIIIGLLVGSVAVIALAIGLAVSLIKCNKNKENDLSDLSLKATTDANNQSNYGTLTYNEDLDISEISFNTYDNIELHIGLVHKINDNNLQWAWCDTINGDYTTIDSEIEGTGLVANKSTNGQIDINASKMDTDRFTYKDFYMEANLPDSALVPEPILVHFHNAPEVKDSGGIITGTTTTITNFTPSTSLLQYDTIYIPKDIVSITSSIFSNQFTGADNDCKNIHNLVFADRPGKTCDVGTNAFSSTTSLVLTGNIYVGSGKYDCINNNGAAYFFSAYASSTTSIEMGGLIINGECSCSGGSANAYFFAAYTSAADATASIAMDDVMINGKCSCSVTGSGGAGYFFTGYASTTAASSFANASIAMDDVTINAECSCSSTPAYYFSAFASTNVASSATASILIGDVTINDKCSCSSTASSVYFFSAHSFVPPSSSLGANASIEMGDVMINGECSCNGGGASPYFFAAYASGPTVSPPTVSILMGKVTINAKCSCNITGSGSLVYFFAAYASSSARTSIEMSDVTINSECSCNSGSSGRVYFFSAYTNAAASIVLGDVKFNTATVTLLGNNKYFFYAVLTSSSIKSFTWDTTVFKTNIATGIPSSYTGGTITWPSWVNNTY